MVSWSGSWGNPCGCPRAVRQWRPGRWMECGQWRPGRISGTFLAVCRTWPALGNILQHQPDMVQVWGPAAALTSTEQGDARGRRCSRSSPRAPPCTPTCTCGLFLPPPFRCIALLLLFSPITPSHQHPVVAFWQRPWAGWVGGGLGLPATLALSCVRPVPGQKSTSVATHMAFPVAKSQKAQFSFQ